MNIHLWIEMRQSRKANSGSVSTINSYSCSVALVEYMKKLRMEFYEIELLPRTNISQGNKIVLSIKL